MTQQGPPSGFETTGNAAHRKPSLIARLLVGIFQFAVGGWAFYVGFVDSRRLAIVAGVVMVAAGIYSIIRYRGLRRTRAGE